ncbi:Crt10p [Kluyveromyces lactis]|uniref:KLLA0C03806p n=1 Tax=Kluyveromyces lactis (strain ATCC 8585 / CBS 2359 / DSM 70799 / NBRC 1267 / NRRL Y-1140 / WM37) TaxID=284590 RepID=Q6CUM3_KLULA|nr:uncharacterized protein KLLA0_C03806g [Kluyveromyces lactis]CAH01217.1 KLLA0C03806p [Kluyveromyces lactis]|eukprot:XP_452366.1 uncharacterized protein KLLA0_C03806g [Kluyveromyces lactis]
MELADYDKRRLNLFLKANGFFLRKLGPSEHVFMGGDNNNDAQGDRYSWCKIPNAATKIDGLHLSERLEQIQEFEVDLSKGADSKYVEGIISRGSDMEPIWGNGKICDPGEILLPNYYQIKVREIGSYPVHVFQHRSGCNNFIILQNRYALYISSVRTIKIVDLTHLSTHNEILDAEQNLLIDDLFTNSSNEYTLSLMERLPSFMGVTVLVFGDSAGNVSFYRESSFITSFSAVPDKAVLNLRLPSERTKVLSCDYVDQSSNLTIFSSKEVLTVLFFDSKERTPISDEITFPASLSCITFLDCTVNGFIVICEDRTATKFTLHFPIKTLQSGQIYYELLEDSKAIDSHGLCSHDESTLISISKDDFLSVPKYEFLTLSYNTSRNEETVRQIYQNSMILEVLPLYPSESNYLGFGASIAQIEVPIPNFSLLYRNDESLVNCPIELRYTAYQKYGKHYHEVYVNKKVLNESFSQDPDCYISKRSHGYGDSKVGKVHVTSDRSDVRQTRIGWEIVSDAELDFCKDYKDKFLSLQDQVETLRIERKGYPCFDLQFIDNIECSADLLRRIYFHKTWKFTQIKSSELKSGEFSPSNIKDCFTARQLDIPILNRIDKDAVDEYVDKSIIKYLRICDESRFNNDGPKFFSKTSGSNFIFEATSTFETSLLGTDPIIMNAFTRPIFPLNFNCVDLSSNKIMVCHLREINCIVVANGSGLMFLYRLTEWRGIYAFRFEKILNILRIQDICDDSDDEERSTFCETNRRFTQNNSDFHHTCNECRLVIKYPMVQSMDYIHMPETNAVLLYVCTTACLVVYEISPNDFSR